MNQRTHLLVYVVIVLLGIQSLLLGADLQENGHGYELFYNGKLVGQEPDWNSRQAIEHFRGITEKYPNIQVTAKFNNEALAYLTKIEVLPVFFVPRDGRRPTSQLQQDFQKHLSLCQEWYREMLKGRDTFTIANREPLIYESHFQLDHYRDDQNGASKITSELLSCLGESRYSCPYILTTVVMNPKEDWPAGGGRPINGGVNTGGGIVIVSSYGVLKSPQFQTTLQHEIGHSFGLCHVKVLGYDMKTNASIMSYNREHHWKRFRPPANPGVLIPENLQKLSLNKLVFPEFQFQPELDIPEGYNMVSKRVDLAEMELHNPRVN